MNRRGFLGGLLKGIAGIAAASVAPQILPTGLFKWKRSGDLYVPAEEQLERYVTEIVNADIRRLLGQIAKSLAENSPFINLIQGGRFPDNMGSTCDVVIS